MTRESAFATVPRHLVQAVIEARAEVEEWIGQGPLDRLKEAERELIEAAIDDIT